jgi:hypothetical protein
MKKGFTLLLVMVVLGLFGSSWAQFPCDPADSAASCCGADSGADGYSWDLGTCDTLHIIPWPKPDTCFEGDCDSFKINNPGEHFPCFVYIPILVTHDSNTFYRESESEWVQDSIAAFALPLVRYWTNPSAYCSLSTYWNQDQLNPYAPMFVRSIWRHFQVSELDSNRMASLAGWFQTLEWSTRIYNWTDDSSWFVSGVDSIYTPPRMWTSLVPSSPTNRRWWEGERTLLFTYTLRVEDTMTVCIDSMLWIPTNFLQYSRQDGSNYYVRHHLPICFRVRDDTVEVVTTDVRWIEGSAEEDNLPTSFSVSQNYPNPFNPATQFKFDLPRASQVKIEIFNILGQRVKTLVDERRRAGSHVVDWNGQDERGVEVSSGVYFYRMWADEFSDIKKMVLLK